MTEWTPIEDLIAEDERDPERLKRLQEARRTLAPIIEPACTGERYERLMRGEGPKRSERK